MISRASSIRCATESRIERDEVAEICIRLPRARIILASGARMRGASWPASRSATKFSIQRTEPISVSTCQKVASTPITKTSTMKPFR